MSDRPLGLPVGMQAVNFQFLFESLPGLYMVLLPDSPRFTAIAASDAYLRATMKTRDDIVGKGVFDVFPDNPDDPLASAVRNSTASFERVLASRGPDTMTAQRHDVFRNNCEADGLEERWWSPVNTPVVNADGSVAYLIHRVDDVTEFVRLKRTAVEHGALATHFEGRTKPMEAEVHQRTLQLQEAEDRLQQVYAKVAQIRGKAHEIFTTAAGGIFVTDREDRQVEVNEAGCALLGCTRDELLGMKTSDLIAPADIERWQHERAKIGDGESCVGEWLVRRKDGSWVCVELRAKRLDDGGQVHFMCDITEKKRQSEAKRSAAEALKRRAQERAVELRKLSADLEVAEDRERRRIARDLHDDIGQTLAAARIWLAGLRSSEQEDVSKAANKVDALVDHANQVTRSLAAQIAPAMLYELGLYPALEWLGQDVQRTFGLKVSVADDGHPKPLSQDVRSILYRATRELLINAAKHAQSESAVVELKRKGERIVVCVSDAGVGFNKAQVLNPAQRGMGLISVRERLAFIGGTAQILSTPGVGTQAELSAPLETDGSALESNAEDWETNFHGSNERDESTSATTSVMQGVIDALNGNIVVLDEHGAIQLVNRAWRDFANQNGDPDLKSCGPGVNYLDVFARSDQSDPLTRRIFDGLKAVLEGVEAEFVSVYSCESQGAMRWFMMQVAPMIDRRYMVVHVDVTNWIDPDRLKALLAKDL